MGISFPVKSMVWQIGIGMRILITFVSVGNLAFKSRNTAYMKYALQDVESLIHLELNPDTILKSPPNEETMLVFSNRIREQQQLIRSFLSEEAFSLKKDKAIESLIQRYQVALIKIADELVQYIQRADNEKVSGNSNAISVRVLYQLALKSVEELLTFIEHHFARYFNIDEKIPESYKLLMQSEFAQNFNALLKRYRLTNIDTDLLEIIMLPFHRFLGNHENRQPTYRELLYLKILLKELEEFLLPDQHSIIERNLLDLLIYLNFNNHRFFNYFVSIIRNNLNDNETINQ